MKILIVEDDTEILDVISMAFEIRWPDVSHLFARLKERRLS